MEDQYGGMADLRQYLSSNSRPLYPPIIPPQDLLSSHRGMAPHSYIDMPVFRQEPTTSAAAPTSSGGGLMEASWPNFQRGQYRGTGRWPRQETLILLEIRSRLDPKFKEANQKGPLWDEVSRIMCEEHGYQRSGKKCREKFENLYKYYKKTKEGKAGRQDGKHYRFFRQLEALYGETNSNTNAAASMSECHVDFRYNFANRNPSFLAAPNQENFRRPKLSDTSLSLSNYSDSGTSDSTDESDVKEGLDNSDLKEKKRRGRKSCKVKIQDFIDAQMKKLMDKQEAWMDKMMKAIEHKERERIAREEEWRKQDAARIEREHRFWASERAWVEARDAVLMDALHKITGSKETTVSSPMAVEISENQNDDGSETMTNSGKGDIWPEDEINRLLIQLRTAMEVKFRTRSSVSDEAALWEEISNEMPRFGHETSALVCKEKRDGVNNYLLKCNNKIRKESSSKGCCTYYQNHDQAAISYCGTSEQPRVDVDHHHHHHTIMRLNDHGNSSPNHNDNNSNNAGGYNSISDSCFRYFMGDAYGRIID